MNADANNIQSFALYYSRIPEHILVQKPVGGVVGQITLQVSIHRWIDDVVLKSSEHSGTSLSL